VEAGGVHEADGRHVHDDFRVAALEELEEATTQAGGGVDVDLALDGQHRVLAPGRGPERQRADRAVAAGMRRLDPSRTGPRPWGRHSDGIGTLQGSLESAWTTQLAADRLRLLSPSGPGDHVSGRRESHLAQ